MRLETHRFDAHEAMGPVEAGLLELLAMHGSPPAIRLERVGDVLVVSGPGKRVEVMWRFRAASRAPRPGMYGRGQWEVRHDGEYEPYAQLDALMGRLSALVRDMARADAAENVADPRRGRTETDEGVPAALPSPPAGVGSLDE
jgi:hypothetical protein